jgi:hypothetical protein
MQPVDIVEISKDIHWFRICFEIWNLTHVCLGFCIPKSHQIHFCGPHMFERGGCPVVFLFTQICVCVTTLKVEKQTRIYIYIYIPVGVQVYMSPELDKQHMFENTAAGGPRF